MWSWWADFFDGCSKAKPWSFLNDSSKKEPVVNSNCLVGCMVMALCVRLLPGDKTPGSGLCGYLTSFFLLIPWPFRPPPPHQSPVQATSQSGRVRSWAQVLVCADRAECVCPVGSHRAPFDWRHFQVNFSAVSKRSGSFFSGLILCAFSSPWYLYWNFICPLKN